MFFFVLGLFVLFSVMTFGAQIVACVGQTLIDLAESAR
jgi:hypothetical protein